MYYRVTFSAVKTHALETTYRRHNTWQHHSGIPPDPLHEMKHKTPNNVIISITGYSRNDKPDMPFRQATNY